MKRHKGDKINQGIGLANMENFHFYLKKAAKFHGHACVGIAMGTKITLAALKVLGLDPQQKTRDLIVYAEIDRCMTDAVQAITGCSLGRRSLKHVDYGKFAATFVNTTTGKAVRATIREDFPTKGPKEEVIQSIALTPDDDMVILQEVQIEIAETDLPGPPREKRYVLPAENVLWMPEASYAMELSSAKPAPAAPITIQQVAGVNCRRCTAYLKLSLIYLNAAGDIY